DDHGASGTDDASGAGVTLTWLIHDVSAWRVDRVYLAADGGPLISTQMNLDGGDPWAQPPLWHRAGANAKALTSLLNRLGVGPLAGSASSASDQIASETAGTSGAGASETGASETGAGTGTAGTTG